MFMVTLSDRVPQEPCQVAKWWQFADVKEAQEFARELVRVFDMFDVMPYSVAQRPF